MSRSTSELVEAVAGYTVGQEMESEDWEKGVAVNGLLAADQHTDRAQMIIDRAIETQTKNGQFAYGWGDYPKSWIERTDFLQSYKPNFNQAALGHGVLEFYERTKDDRYLKSADRYYEFIQSVDRTEDGGLSHRRDVVELWVDALYFIAPFMARYGAITGNSEAIDEAVSQLIIHAKHLQDPHTGLFRHNWREYPNSYPQSTFWSRGIGWATTAIIDTLPYVPNDHPRRDQLINILEHTANTLLDLQDDSGFWHHILGGEERMRSPLETSGTLMFSYTFQRGNNDGLLEAEYSSAAQRAFEVCKDTVDDDGAVRRVADKPGGPGAPLDVTSFGQGWFLLAASLFNE